MDRALARITATKRRAQADRAQRAKREMNSPLVNPPNYSREKVLEDLYRAGISEGTAKEKYARRGGLAVGGVVGVAGAVAAHQIGVGRLVSNTYATVNEIDNFGKAIKNVFVGDRSRELQQIIQSAPDYKQLQQEYQRYANNVNSRVRALQEAQQAYDSIARISSSTPGYETKFIQNITALRNKLQEGMTTVTQGRENAQIRNNPQYEQNWVRLVDLTSKALEAKNLGKAELKELTDRIGNHLKETGRTTDRELKIVEKQMQEISKYSDLISQARKLTPREIQGATEAYNSVVGTARGYGLREGRPLTERAIDYGTDASIGLVLAAYAAKLGSYLGKGAYKVRDLMTGGRKAREARAINEAKSGLETKVGIFFVVSFLSILLFRFSITGNVVSTTFDSRNILWAGIVISILILVLGIMLLRNIYKRSKRN